MSIHFEELPAFIYLIVEISAINVFMMGSEKAGSSLPLSSSSSSSKLSENAKAALQVQEKLKTFIEREVKTLQSSTTNPSIYKVPKELRAGHEELFDPISIPIGPLHHDKETPALREFKKWYLKNYIGRLDPAAGVDDLAQTMSSLESKFQESYRDIDRTIITGEKLVQIMLLDGCFIMELLWSHKDYEIETLVGSTDKVPLLNLQQDLLKIENQIPFLVLQTLADLASHNKGNMELDVMDLSLKFFRITKPPNFVKTDRPRHLLELIMKALFHKNQSPSPSPSPIGGEDHQIDVHGGSSLTQAMSASELEYYGIEFRAGDESSLTRIEFKGGKLVIPPLVIQESTATVLWNFLIFETSSCDSRVFTSYVVLMDSLINNKADVEVLLREKILVSRKNDTERLVSLFNEMSASVSRKDFYYEDVVQKVNHHCRSSYRPMRAYLVRNYYDARWSVLSNILLFILTVTQTLFSAPDFLKKAGN